MSLLVVVLLALGCAGSGVEHEETGPGPRAEPAAAPRLGEGATQTSHRNAGSSRLALAFTPLGLEIGPLDTSGPDFRWSLKLAAYGRRGALLAAEPPTRTTSPDEVRYARSLPGGGDLVEWYITHPQGIEQGFDIPVSLPGPATGEVVLELLAPPTLVGELSADAHSVVYRDFRGTLAFAYQDLHVEDARGVTVPAELEISPETLRIVIHDGDALYPIRVDPLITTWQTQLSGAIPMDEFGRRVALAGNTLAVKDATKVYIFVNQGGAWTLEGKVSSPGYELDLQGETLVVGSANNCFIPPCPPGEVRVFVRTGGAWALEQKVKPIDSHATDAFGSSVALSGDVLAVGAYEEGAAYVFTRSNSVWTQQKKLAFTGVTAIDIDGDTLAVGSRYVPYPDGRVRVYRNLGGDWSQEYEYTSALTEFLGESLSLDKDTLVAFGQGNFPSTGEAHIFVRTANVWSEQTTLYGHAGDGSFGYSLALSGDRLVAGDPRSPIFDGVGSTYVYDRKGATWTEKYKLVPSDLTDGSGFGLSVAFEGETIVSSAPYKEGKGAVYITTLSGLAVGSSCSLPTQCLSGYCADGVCCETACGGGLGDCQACSVAAGSAVDGVCQTVIAGVVCRPAAGPCDVDDLCDGTSTTCGSDNKMALGTLCRPAANACDADETCDGNAASCPEDSPLADGAACDDLVDCTVGDTCQNGLCVSGPDNCGAGGSSATGGGSSATGGGSSATSSTGGATSTRPTGVGGGDSEGCSCRTAGHDAGLAGRPSAWLGLAALGLLWRRRAPLRVNGPV